MLPSDAALSARKLEVLTLAANGRTNQQIADELWVDIETVKTHFQLIKKHLGARDRTHAVAVALVRGIIHPSAISLT